MGCDLLDFRCIIVSELIGSAILAVIIGAIFYFIIASKTRMGFDTTLILGIPFLLILGIGFAGFTAIYAFLTIVIGFMLAWIFTEITRGR